MAGFRNSNKNDGLGNIKIPTELFKRGEKALAKELGKSRGIKPSIRVILGNAVTGQLFVPDTNDSRLFISDEGDEPSALGSIAKIGIPKELIRLNQKIRVIKNASGNYEYDGVDTETAEVFNEGDSDSIDQSPISQSQFDFASLQPFSGMVATVKGAIYGDSAVLDLSTADFSASPLDTASAAIDIPTTANRAIGVLIQLDPATSTLSYKQSSEFASSVSLPQAYAEGLLPLRDAGKKRVGYIRLANGITQLDYASVWSCAEFFPDTGTLTDLVFATATELTIASGAITISDSFHRIDTESNAASDDLDTINGGVAGKILIIRAENTARTVVVRHNGGGTGNIRTPNAEPISLDETYKALILIYDGNLSLWLVIGGNANPSPDSLTTYGSPPDESLVFAAQSIGTSDFFKLTGDEMRRWLASAPATSFSTDSRALQAYAFNSSTDRTITINSSSVFAGQQMRIHTVQVSGGTGHKVLLPAGVYFGETGTNRAALFDAVGDKLDALCFDIGGTLRFLYFESGVTFAAS